MVWVFGCINCLTMTREDTACILSPAKSQIWTAHRKIPNWVTQNYQSGNYYKSWSNSLNAKERCLSAFYLISFSQSSLEDSLGKEITLTHNSLRQQHLKWATSITSTVSHLHSVSAVQFSLYSCLFLSPREFFFTSFLDLITFFMEVKEKWLEKA